jgi:cyclophilin family peptidyl-prolyl cis-trans isomerase
LQPADAELTASLLAPPAAETASEEGKEPLAATPTYADASKAVGRRFRLFTLHGVIDIELLPDAVYTAANFAKLADAGFYNGTRFHRVIGNFVAQGGDPTGTGEGGPGWRIREELSPLPHAMGYVGMATAGKDTAGSQFFINTGRNPHLDWHYTVFARVIAGLPAALQLRQGEALLRVDALP